MKRISLLLGTTLAFGIALGVLGSHLVSAQEPLKAGTVLQRADVAGCKGTEALLVLREIPPGGESGKHTQSGTEIVYVVDGSLTVEKQGKPPETLKQGDSFTTTAGEVHNVKNASTSAPVKALAFYTAKKGAKLEDLSKQAK